ncbi:hypothetical protein ACNKHL_11055 [Shigella flexneri]
MYKSERKVAEVIWLRPITRLIRVSPLWHLEANVSEPTVNRFCRSMDTRWFPDFKLHLATESGQSASPMLIATSMKMTALNYTQENIELQWQCSIMSVIHSG